MLVHYSRSQVDLSQKRKKRYRCAITVPQGTVSMLVGQQGYHQLWDAHESGYILIAHFTVDRMLGTVDHPGLMMVHHGSIKGPHANTQYI